MVRQKICSSAAAHDYETTKALRVAAAFAEGELMICILGASNSFQNLFCI
jgi:hypothetical protein